MSTFQPCFDWTISKEGKTLSRVQGDAGGLTWWGIAENENLQWAGWPIIDRYLQSAKNFDEALNLCLHDQNLIGLTVDFYKANFLAHHLDQLNYQELALQVFDHFWNMGGIALKNFQILVGQKPDGLICPATIAAANSIPGQSQLVDSFLDWCKTHYEWIAGNYPNDAKFLKGWEDRCVRSDGLV